MRPFESIPHFGQYVFIAMLAVISITLFGMLKPFLMGVFWAVVMAILFFGWYEKLLEKLGGRDIVASLIMTFFIFLVVVVPLTGVGIAIIDEALSISSQINSGEIDIQLQVDAATNMIPKSAERLFKFKAENIPQLIGNELRGSAQTIGNWLVTITSSLLEIIMHFSIMLYVLFFFFKDGRKIIKQIVWVLPFGDEREIMLMKRFQRVTKATVKGSLFIAILQGALGWVLFVIIGVPGAVILGAVMVVSALLPIGTSLVWGPVGIIYILNGQTVEGVIILIVGNMLIGLIDNILRPRLVGSDTKLPDYIILLSTLGGLSWFGVSGFIIGPVLAALFVTCWQIMGQDYGESDRPEDIKLQQISEDISEL